VERGSSGDGGVTGPWRLAEGGGAAAPRRPGWWWGLTFHLGPDLIFLGLFSLTLGVLFAVYDGKFTFVQTSIVLPALFMFGLIAVSFAPRARAIASGDAALRREFTAQSLHTTRDWLPLILIIFVYENFHDLTDLIRPTTVDASLRALDEALFGVEPALALEPYVRVWLSEYMTFAYALYFLYPAGCLIGLYVSRRFIEFREVALALSLTFYLGLLGYVLVPAVGPRFFMAAEFHTPLVGPLTSRLAAAWNAIETVKRDCFPSLHTALTTTSLIYMYRYRRAWRYGRLALLVCTPLIVSLWASTIYLRYHYGVDVLAGWALALLVTQAAPRFIRRYYAVHLGRAPHVSLDEG